MEQTELGGSLRRLAYLFSVTHSIAYENSAGLPEIYNAALDALPADDIVVFVHDDVVIYDYFLPHRLVDGLAHFDVIGPVGGALPEADHAGWGCRLPAGEQKVIGSSGGGSGAVSHLFPTHEMISNFGPTPRRVALLDGLFIAARVATLRRAGVRFDERFRFHFYDIDFCRTCLSKGLKIGTWPIALVHGSEGSFTSPSWHEGLAAYRAKWGMTVPQP